MRIHEMLLQIENETGCNISIEPMHSLFHSCEALRIPYHKMLHNHAFCRFVKSTDSNVSCARNKHRSMKIAACGHRFCGCCAYGVWELVQPVMWQGRLLAILYFGYYSLPGRALTIPEGRAYTGPALPPITPAQTALLKEWAAFFARFIRCEVQANMERMATPEKQHGAKHYCDIVRNLIASRYMDDLRLQDAATACKVNPNYLSNLLKASTGNTFRQMLTEQRIVEAQACLKYHGEMSVAQIAVACGFRDGNYFSLVFSRKCGVSPTDFRRNWKTDARLAQL